MLLTAFLTILLILMAFLLVAAIAHLILVILRDLRAEYPK